MRKTKEDIVFTRNINGKYDSIQRLPKEINTDGFEFNAFVSPDEDYIVFSGYNRADGFGSADLYISRKDENGKWIQAKNMGSKINSPFLDYCPFISFDGKSFFFTSKRNKIKSPMKNAVDFKQLENILTSPANGADDIYWIKWDALKE